MGRENKDYFKNNNKPMSFEDTAKSSNIYENNTNEATIDTEESKKESNIATESIDQKQEATNITVSEDNQKAIDNNKKKTEYKGELGNLLNDVEVGHKFTGFNIDNDIVQRLDAFCEGKPRGTKTKLVNLILRNGLDNIESKGKL
ncbi:hypothetical protein [Staphylococcus warneri]|uniref:hypothetical protein n=1 Tax=Staphylococcus warneri TaxID=1292 RepID=UPI003261C4CD